MPATGQTTRERGHKTGRATLTKIKRERDMPTGWVRQIIHRDGSRINRQQHDTSQLALHKKKPIGMLKKIAIYYPRKSRYVEVSLTKDLTTGKAIDIQKINNEKIHFLPNNFCLPFSVYHTDYLALTSIY